MQCSEKLEIVDDIAVENMAIVLILYCQTFEDSPGPVWPPEGKREYHALTRWVSIIIITITTIIIIITTIIIIYVFWVFSKLIQGTASQRGVQESPP